MPKQIPPPCTREEMDKLIEAAKDDDFFYMLFKVARKTGRRLGEYYGEPEMKVVGEERYKDRYGLERIRKIKRPTNNYVGGVQVKDIDFDRKVMMTQILKRKKRVYREALLDDELVNLIKSYIRKHQLKLGDYLFRKVSYRQIQYRVNRYAKKAGIPHVVSFHSFRHYLITELFKKGWDYSQIAKITGHSSVGTIAVYDHSVASDIREKAMKDIVDI